MKVEIKILVECLIKLKLEAYKNKEDENNRTLLFKAIESKVEIKDLVENLVEYKAEIYK